MADTENSELTQRIVEATGLQSIAGVPRGIAGNVQPTIDVNPDHNRVVDHIVSATRVITGAGTLFLCPSDKDFYLCGCSLNWEKDATSDGTLCEIEATPFGMTEQHILQLVGITLTAGVKAATFNFGSIGIKQARGSTMKIRQTFGVGVEHAAATIWGYFKRTQ